MAPTKDTETDAPKQTLPVGHPQAGYLAPDLTGSQGAGTLPDHEQEWHDDLESARDEDVEAVAENEDQVAKAEAKELEDKLADARAKDEAQVATQRGQTPAKTSTSKDQS